MRLGLYDVVIKFYYIIGDVIMENLDCNIIYCVNKERKLGNKLTVLRRNNKINQITGLRQQRDRLPKCTLPISAR